VGRTAAKPVLDCATYIGLFTRKRQFHFSGKAVHAALGMHHSGASESNRLYLTMKTCEAQIERVRHRRYFRAPRVPMQYLKTNTFA
jgi:hypothetical protein